MISPEEKQKVREATDLVALVGETVALRSRGRDYWGCCPFHHEKSPSFHVMPDRGFWKCFSCGKGGDCFDYIIERDHLEFPEAVRMLAERAGIQLAEEQRPQGTTSSGSRKARLYDAVEEAVAFYHAQLTRVRSPEADEARGYLGRRGFGSAVAGRWDLGFAPGMGALVRHLGSKGFTSKEIEEADLAVRRGGRLQDRFYNRVIFPIRDERGRAIGLGGRVLDDSKPKYLNTAETPIFRKGETLFAFDRAKAHITAQMQAVVMEGYTDVISSHEAGICNVVAPLGTAFRARHVRMLARSLTGAGERVTRGSIVFIFDGDEAGLRAAERAMQFVPLTTATMLCVVLPDGKDPAEFLASDGPDALRTLIASPVPLVRFVADRHLDRFDVSTPEVRALALADVVAALAPIKGTSLADDYVQYVAGRLLADVGTVKSALAAVRWVPPVEDDEPGDDSEMVSVAGAGQQASLDLGSAGPAAQLARQAVALLPGDEVMMGVERKILSAMAGDVGAARPFANRAAEMSWVDPDHEAIAWAILAAPEGSSASDVLTAAEAVCPRAAAILADGASALAEEAPAERTLDILFDDLEMRCLRRSIDQGRAMLRVADFSGPGGADELFERLTAMQRRLVELEQKVRTRV